MTVQFTALKKIKNCFLPKISDRKLLDFLVLFGVLTLVCLVVAPPLDVFSNNEETKFGMAYRFINPDWNPHSFSFGIPQKFYLLFDSVVGSLILLFGFETAHCIARILMAGLYGFSLSMLFTVLRFSPAQAAIVVLGYCAAGQSMVGKATMFVGIEPKTIACAFTFLGLSAMIEKRFLCCSIFMCLATFAHVHVGGLIAGFFAIAFLLAERGRYIRELVKPALVYIAFVGLYAGFVWKRYVGFVAEPVKTSIDMDFLIAFRSTHHVWPFFKKERFLEDWLPGFVALFFMLVAAIYILKLLQKTERKDLRFIGILTVVLHVYLFIALWVASDEERAIALSKFLLFRPAAYALFCWLILCVGWLGTAMLEKGRQPAINVLLIGTIAAYSFYFVRVDLPVLKGKYNNKQSVKGLYRRVVRSSTPDDIFVVSENNEWDHLGFERKTGRAMYVMNKFIVTESPHGLAEWSKRKDKRNDIFKNGCKSKFLDEVDFIIINKREYGLFENCTEIVHSTSDFLLSLNHNSTSGKSAKHTP